MLDPARGWLRVPRSLLSGQHPLHPRQTGEEACKALALIDLLALARWRDEDLPRGSCRASVRYLAERWNWPKSTVDRFLDALEEDGTIRRERPSRNRPSVISFPDYDDLQAHTVPEARKRDSNGDTLPGHTFGTPERDTVRPGNKPHPRDEWDTPLGQHPGTPFRDSNGDEEKEEEPTQSGESRVGEAGRREPREQDVAELAERQGIGKRDGDEDAEGSALFDPARDGEGA